MLTDNEMASFKQKLYDQLTGMRQLSEWNIQMKRKIKSPTGKME